MVFCFVQYLGLDAGTIFEKKKNTDRSTFNLVYYSINSTQYPNMQSWRFDRVLRTEVRKLFQCFGGPG